MNVFLFLAVIFYLQDSKIHENVENCSNYIKTVPVYKAGEIAGFPERLI